MISYDLVRYRTVFRFGLNHNKSLPIRVPVFFATKSLRHKGARRKPLRAPLCLCVFVAKKLMEKERNNPYKYQYNPANPFFIMLNKISRKKLNAFITHGHQNQYTTNTYYCINNR